MSVILVVEQDANTAERIREVLRSNDQSVAVVGSRAEALSRAEREVPRLLLASSTLPQAAELLAAFSRQQGGPGAIVLVPQAEVSEGTAADLRADEILTAPFSDDDLIQLVERCLNEASSLPPKTSKPPSDAEQLTSEDIFGDVLAEVEGEAKHAASVPVPPRQSKLSKSDRSMEDIERKLEETLSGVIPTGAKNRRARKRLPEPPSDAEIDDLLDKTLSSLDIPTRGRRSQAAREPAVAATPERSILPEAEELTHRATGSDLPVEIEPPPDLPLLADFEPLAEPVPEPEPAPEPESAPEPEPAAEPEATFEPMTPPEPTPISEPDSLPAPEAQDPVFPAAPEFEPSSMFGDSPKDQTGATSEAAPPALGSASPVSDLRAGGDQFATQALPMLDLIKQAAGESFGDYTLLDRIAVGGMAEVWRARRRGVEGFQKTVAIKKILSHLTGSADFVTMFIDEAKLAAQLSHNNIIQIYDLGKVGTDFFIAMEYVEGKDLRSILSAAQASSQPIAPSLGLYIISAVARALDYAHRKRDFDNRALGLVHRDVSPQNVLISYEGEIKLCDFGIVKAVAKASTTQMGALKGKLQYMSPEQAWGKSVDARSDIFSLGSVFYELLTGVKLFSGESEIGVLDAVRACQIRSPREILPDLPEEVERIVLKALAKTPEKRYQTAGDMEQELQTALENLKPTPSQSDLATFLRDLFADHGPEAQQEDGTGTGSGPATAVDPTPSAAPATESGNLPPQDSEARGGGGLKWLIAALVAITVLIGVAVMVNRSRTPAESPAQAGDATPEVGTVPPSPPATTPVAGTPAAEGSVAATPAATPTAGALEQNPATPTSSSVVESMTEAEEEPTAGSSEATSPSGATGLDIEQMVNEELTNRAERLRKDFEAEKKRIEKELAKAQSEDKPTGEDGDSEPPPEAGGGEENEGAGSGGS